MDENRRYYRLGVFVVVTVALLAAILFILGGRSLFQPTFVFETYFDESVAGLEIGAPIKYRGVPVGTVSEILTSSATYEADVPLNKRRSYIVVRVKVTGSRAQAQQVERDIAEMVRLGLRVQTQLAGITGQLFLGLDYLNPEKYPGLPFGWTPQYTYVPSAPSLTGEIIANAQEFLASLNEANIKALGQNLNALVVDLDKKIGDLPIAELSADVKKVLNELHAVLARVDRVIASAPIAATVQNLESASARLDALLADPALTQVVDNLAAVSDRLRKIADSGDVDRLADNLAGMSDRLRKVTDSGDVDRLVANLAAVSDRLRRLTDSGDLDRLVKRLDEAAERLDDLIGDNQYDVRVLVRDLRVTAGNLRTLSESIKRYPAGLLTGGPPEKVELPRESK